MNTSAINTLENWKGTSVLITGVCGTIGSELLRQLSDVGCRQIIGIDNNESELFFLSQAYAGRSDIRLFLGDLRDRDELLRKMRGINIVIHAAALKHVILCEESPRDAVQTNIVGMINVIDAAEANRVDRMIFTSSDKAVNPTNVMGTTKLMGERLVTAANAHRQDDVNTLFSSVRFGNILGSRGSVIPLFKKQIENGGPVTLTDPNMTRFIMTIEDAVKMVMSAVFIAHGGEVFVTKMPVVRIEDLAKVLIDILAPQFGYRPSDIRIETIGVKSGEKMYEELLNEEEIRRTIELRDYFAILPAFKSVYQQIDYRYESIVSDRVEKPYNSRLEIPMGCDSIHGYLMKNGLLKGK